MINDNEQKILNEMGGELLEGSGFEAESDERDRRYATLQELRKIGSLTCGILPDKLPTSVR